MHALSYSQVDLTVFVTRSLTQTIMSESTAAQPENASTSAPVPASDTQTSTDAASLISLGQQQIAKQSFAEAAETFSKAVESL